MNNGLIKSRVIKSIGAGALFIGAKKRTKRKARSFLGLLAVGSFALYINRAIFSF